MPIVIPGSISGADVIDDLCGRIAEGLSRDCSLRQIDRYTGYTATVEIKLQLEDVYPVEVAVDIMAGTLNPQLPSQHITLDSAVTGEEPDASGLERPVDPAGATRLRFGRSGITSPEIACVMPNKVPTASAEANANSGILPDAIRSPASESGSMLKLLGPAKKSTLARRPENGYTSHHRQKLMAHAQPLIAAILCCSAISIAQQTTDRKAPDAPEKPTPTSTVTGHIYLDDTKAPARKATVYLVPVALLQRDDPPDRGGGRANGPVTTGVGTQFDGGYLFTHVAPGSYYVFATCPGYISPLISLSLAEARSPYGEWAPLGPQQKIAKYKILQSLPRIDVQSNLPTSVDVVLERGGAVSGTVSYDDGGPAAGLQVEVLARMIQDGKESWDSVESQHTHNSKIYISSSGSGGYGTNAHSATLAIYSGNTPRQKNAVAFAIQAREERTGEDIVIPMSKLHTIKGNIVSAQDGHVVNSGQVDLLNADDHSLEGSDGLTEDDPNFTLSFIFEGDYILSSPASADVDYVALPRQHGNLEPPQFSTHPRHLYGSTSKPLHVDGDMDGVTLAVPEPTAKEAQIYKDAMQLEEQNSHTTPPQ